MTLAELALRFILSNDIVSTTIPGMRKVRNVEANTATSDAGPLKKELLEKLKTFRWVRKPKPWSD
jgi:aryl-alcohol dehydrogenase-like predicted oxidoreductase